jgi:molybdopterin-binding protein
MSASSRTQAAPSEVRGQDLRVVYRAKEVLAGDDVIIPAGRTYALLGASGAGKSTLLRVMGLLERPTGGTITYDGLEVAESDQKARRRIAAVFQKPYLLRGTIAHNVGYGLRVRRVPSPERKARIAEGLARVGLGGWEDRSAMTLSGGEAQRVALARALVLKPSFLLLDEPLSYLDPLLKRDLTREFADVLASEHVTALYVTHDQDEAAVVADIIGIMREGRIIAQGDPQTVITIPTDSWVAAFLGTETASQGVVVRTEDGLAAVDCGGVEVLATSELPVGTRVSLGIRPEDVILFEPGADLPLTSARNRIDATIVSLTPAGATVRATAQAGDARFSATVSRLSAASLELAEGRAVTLLFKATAVQLRAL